MERKFVGDIYDIGVLLDVHSIHRVTSLEDDEAILLTGISVIVGAGAFFIGSALGGPKVGYALGGSVLGLAALCRLGLALDKHQDRVSARKRRERAPQTLGELIGLCVTKKMESVSIDYGICGRCRITIPYTPPGAVGFEAYTVYSKKAREPDYITSHIFPLFESKGIEVHSYFKCLTLSP